VELHKCFIFDCFHFTIFSFN